MSPRQYSSLLAIAIVAGFAAGAAATLVFQPRVIKAEGFHLVDSTGRTRAILATHSPWSTAASPLDHVGLALYDSSGMVRVQVSWEERKSPDGNTVGTASIELRNRSGISQSSIQLTDHPYFANSTLTISDGADKVTWIHPAGVNLSGPGATVSLSQPQQDPDLRLSLEGEGHRPRLTLVNRPEPGAPPSPVVEIRDQEGKTTWAAP